MVAGEEEEAMTLYPVIANCLYESADPGEPGVIIHKARLAADAGRVSDERLDESLGELERVLRVELHENGAYRNGILSGERIDAAEGAVVEAWEKEDGAE